MSFIKYLNSQFTVIQTLDFCFRLILACACGAVIGLERSRRFKEAGIRTHIIVCCASALLMIVSKYGFVDTTMLDGAALHGTHGADPARVAAQAVSGISFLGAGVIFKNGGSVKGLTTAACIWATSAIGLAVGAGMWVISLLSVVLITGIQLIMHRFAIGLDAYATNRLQFTVRNGFEFNQSLTEQLDEWHAQVTDSKVTRRKDGTTDYDLTVRRRTEITYKEMKEFIEAHQEILTGSNSPLR